MAKRRKRYEARIYLGRDESGKQRFDYIGRFDRKRDRDKAVRKAKEEREARELGAPLPLCDNYVDRYLAEYERRHKASSLGAATRGLRRFREDFARRSLDISRAELKDWMNGEGVWSHKPPVPRGYRPTIVTLYNHAIDEDDLPLSRNPFRRLGTRTKGRADQPPPTEEQFETLLEACSALRDYGKVMRALMLFAAFTLMRPGELYPLEWTDLDFRAMRLRKARRLYRGELDEPKSGPVTIALTPPARDAVLGLPREGSLVFYSKTGKRLSQSTLSGYWAQVCAKADLEFDFYHATKHYGVHYMWTQLGISRRAIAAQAGWSLSTVDKMLAIYGHGDVGALEEVDAAFKATKVLHLRKIEGGASAAMPIERASGSQAGQGSGS
jgi:integrase